MVVVVSFVSNPTFELSWGCDKKTKVKELVYSPLLLYMPLIMNIPAQGVFFKLYENIFCNFCSINFL